MPGPRGGQVTGRRRDGRCRGTEPGADMDGPVQHAVRPQQSGARTATGHAAAPPVTQVGTRPARLAPGIVMLAGNPDCWRHNDDHTDSSVSPLCRGPRSWITLNRARRQVSLRCCSAALATGPQRRNENRTLPVQSLNYAGTLAWVRSFAFTIRFSCLCAKPPRDRLRNPFRVDLGLSASWLTHGPVHISEDDRRLHTLSRPMPTGWPPGLSAAPTKPA